jgi:hypothetical protein
MVLKCLGLMSSKHREPWYRVECHGSDLATADGRMSNLSGKPTKHDLRWFYFYSMAMALKGLGRGFQSYISQGQLKVLLLTPTSGS